MKESHYHSLVRLYRALKFSWCGIQVAWKKQPAFRQECFLFFILLPIVFYLSISLEFKLLLILLLILLLTIEIINSAIETIIDRISMDEHLLSKEAKDLGSAAVLIILLINIVVWLLAVYKTIFE